MSGPTALFAQVFLVVAGAQVMDLISPEELFQGGMPVVVNMGPVMDLGDMPTFIIDDGDDDGFEDSRQPVVADSRKHGVADPRQSRQIKGRNDVQDQFDQLHQHLLTGLLDNFGPHLGTAMQSGSGGFQTEVKKGHFYLRASLPGYKMHQSGENENSQPLSVQVLGQTLVVKGRKTQGAMTSSFQRSFPLPWQADAEKISVTYSAYDGGLSVDVPAKAGADAKVAPPRQSDEEEEDFIPIGDLSELFGAPQMTIAFSHDSPGPVVMPTLRGGRRPRMPALLQDLLRGQPPPGHVDPFEELFRAMEEQSRLDHAGTAQQNKQNKASADAAGTKVAALPGPTSPPPTAPPEKAPVLLQPKNAKPFWRLGESSQDKFVDIVTPAGTDTGLPDGTTVKLYTADGKSDGVLTLPVSVKAEDCARTSTGSQERVLRCHIKEDAVKNVRISVIDEL